ncbi:hypothetical protein [Streptomyces sp. NPDC059787]|uniref:hypothetical protein n=1 Tax=Streptomyces sp. NPDC059787 TaxID=3346947 RepID=UPI003652C245
MRPDLTTEDLLFSPAAPGRAVPALTTVAPDAWLRPLALLLDGLRPRRPSLPAGSARCCSVRARTGDVERSLTHAAALVARPFTRILSASASRSGGKRDQQIVRHYRSVSCWTALKTWPAPSSAAM